MASSGPPALPLANSDANASSDPPIANPALRRFLDYVSSSAQQALSHCRPWSELLDRSQFSKPQSLSDASFRLRKNLLYFRLNYLILVSGVLAFSLLSHPFSLILLLALLAAWLFLYLFRPSDQPLNLFGRTYSDRETLGILILLSVVIVFLTEVGSLLISGVLVGSAIVCVHGAFRMPEDLFLEEQEAHATGFLLFLGGATSNAAAASPPVAARG